MISLVTVHTLDRKMLLVWQQAIWCFSVLEQTKGVHLYVCCQNLCGCTSNQFTKQHSLLFYFIFLTQSSVIQEIWTNFKNPQNRTPGEVKKKIIKNHAWSPSARRGSPYKADSQFMCQNIFSSCTLEVRMQGCPGEGTAHEQLSEWVLFCSSEFYII